MRKAKRQASEPFDAKNIDTLGAPVEVRRHPTARRLTLRVSRTRRSVIVTLPTQCDIDEAGSFITRNIEWVRARLDSLPTAVPFKDGVYVPLRGTPHRVTFLNEISGRAENRRTVAQCHDGDHPQLLVSGLAEHAPRRLMDWLWKEARADLDVSVQKYSSQIGIHPKRVTVRDQSSRWGSCSTTGVLSFSWRLILAPPSVLDYVAAHEVAHLQEMNHGPKFWALVEKLDPDMDVSRKWLQIYGMDLHRYGT